MLVFLPHDDELPKKDISLNAVLKSVATVEYISVLK